MLRCLVSIAAFALLIVPASAGTEWSDYGNFSSTRCEDAKTIADIKESLKGLTFNDNGRRTFAEAFDVRILRSTTLRADANSLVCQLRIQTHENGQTLLYNARHTVKLYPDGRWTTQYQPNS